MEGGVETVAAFGRGPQGQPDEPRQQGSFEKGGIEGAPITEFGFGGTGEVGLEDHPLLPSAVNGSFWSGNLLVRAGHLQWVGGRSGTRKMIDHAVVFKTLLPEVGREATPGLSLVGELEQGGFENLEDKVGTAGIRNPGAFDPSYGVHLPGTARIGRLPLEALQSRGPRRYRGGRSGLVGQQQPSCVSWTTARVVQRTQRNALVLRDSRVY